MNVIGRRAAPSNQIQALTDTNALLQANNAQLRRANVDLEATNAALKRAIKSLQIVVAILLASSGG